MRRGIIAVLTAMTGMIFNFSPVNANPVAPGGITEFSVDPDWIEVDMHYWELGKKEPVIIDGKEVNIIWDKVYPDLKNDRIIIDNSNTSGFDLKPEGGSIYFPAIRNTLYYGSGQMYPTPLPGESVAFRDD